MVHIRFVIFSAVMFIILTSSSLFELFFVHTFPIHNYQFHTTVMRRRANKFTFVLTPLFGLFVNLFVCLFVSLFFIKKKKKDGAEDACGMEFNLL